jgi:hypothetical protein
MDFARKHAPHLEKTYKSRCCNRSAIAVVGDTNSSTNDGRDDSLQRVFLLFQVQIRAVSASQPGVVYHNLQAWIVTVRAGGRDAKRMTCDTIGRSKDR